MTYEGNQTQFLKGGIRFYKRSFKGINSTLILSHLRTIRGWISKRVYLTKKRHYVYYERTDVNWNYWDKGKEDSV